jgi:hypothetical protein
MSYCETTQRRKKSLKEKNPSLKTHLRDQEDTHGKRSMYLFASQSQTEAINIQHKEFSRELSHLQTQHATLPLGNKFMKKKKKIFKKNEQRVV